MILGVIATFTIPKVLSAQQSQQKTAVLRETAAMVAAAYQTALSNGVVTSNTRLQDLTPYFNYLSVDTSAVIDDTVGYADQTCNGGIPCYKLHNGAILMDRAGFGGTGTTNVMIMHLDPDGTYNGGTTGDGKSVQLILYYNGRITSRGQIPASILSALGTWATDQNADPPWVNWT